MKRNIIQEIEMKRVRYNHNESLTLIRQLKDYETMLKNDTTKNTFDYQPLHFIPVTICSAFESFFRAAIKDIIDLNRTNIKKIIQISEIKSFRFDFLLWDESKSKEISLGEFVSILIRIKKIKSINVIFSILLNTDFLGTLKSFRHLSKGTSVNEVEEYWSKNYNAILKDIDSTYELRNIVCHEFGFWIDVSRDTLFRYLRNSIAFLEHVDFYFYYLFNPSPQKIGKRKDVTLAKKSFLAKEKQFKELILKISETSDNLGYEMSAFEEVLSNEIILWKQHRRKVAKSNCEMYIGTQNFKTIYWHNMAHITDEMIDILLRRHESLFFEAEKHSKVQKFI